MSASSSSFSSSLPGYIEEILRLSLDARFLAAKDVWKQHNVDAMLPTVQDESIRKRLETIRVRIDEVSGALKEQALTEDSEWVHAISYFGIDTHYKYKSTNDFQIRVEGELEGVPVFEQAAVVHEVDLWTDWMPFVKHSRTVAKVSHGEIVAYAVVSLPLISRDVLMHLYSADCLQEAGKVVILGKSIESWPTFDEATMAKSYGWMSHDRVIMHEVKVVVDVISPTKIKTIIIMSFDLKLAYMPQSLINFVVRNCAGMFLSFFQARAKSVYEDPSSPTAALILSKTDFYFEFLYIKLKRLCDSRNWTLHHSAAMTTAVETFLASYKPLTASATTVVTSTTSTDSITATTACISATTTTTSSSNITDTSVETGADSDLNCEVKVGSVMLEI